MNLFGDSDYLEKLSLKGDPLERLEKVVDFECFRPTLNRIFKYDLKNKSHGGRPPYGPCFNVENSNFTTLIQSI